jgi:hypothetical protein
VRFISVLLMRTYSSTLIDSSAAEICRMICGVMPKLKSRAATSDPIGAPAVMPMTMIGKRRSPASLL